MAVEASRVDLETRAPGIEEGEEKNGIDRRMGGCLQNWRKQEEGRMLLEVLATCEVCFSYDRFCVTVGFV